MRLIITRSYKERPPGEQYHSPYIFHARLELTSEEKELVATYELGEHVLTRSEYSMTTVKDLIREEDPTAPQAWTSPWATSRLFVTPVRLCLKCSITVVLSEKKLSWTIPLLRFPK